MVQAGGLRAIVVEKGQFGVNVQLFLSLISLISSWILSRFLIWLQDVKGRSGILTQTKLRRPDGRTAEMLGSRFLRMCFGQYIYGWQGHAKGGHKVLQRMTF